MKIYQKMKAAVVDLTEALDEAVAFSAYVGEKQLAYAGANGSVRVSYRVAGESDVNPAESKRQYNADYFTKIDVT